MRWFDHSLSICTETDLFPFRLYLADKSLLRPNDWNIKSDKLTLELIYILSSGDTYLLEQITKGNSEFCNTRNHCSKFDFFL